MPLIPRSQLDKYDGMSAIQASPVHSLITSPMLSRNSRDIAHAMTEANSPRADNHNNKTSIYNKNSFGFEVLDINS